MSLNWGSWYSSYWAVQSVVRRDKVSCILGKEEKKASVQLGLQAAFHKKNFYQFIVIETSVQ